jgi:hypothetical protein
MNTHEFAKALADNGRSYEPGSAVPADCVQFRFIGTFEQKTVIWDAQLATLAYYSRTSPPVTTNAAGLRAFIEVGAAGPRGQQLRIGLNVAIIDEATIRKTMIMIRQYKLLQRGRHDYGEPYQPKDSH